MFLGRGWGNGDGAIWTEGVKLVWLEGESSHGLVVGRTEFEVGRPAAGGEGLLKGGKARR